MAQERLRLAKWQGRSRAASGQLDWMILHDSKKASLFILTAKGRFLGMRKVKTQGYY